MRAARVFAAVLALAAIAQVPPSRAQETAPGPVPTPSPTAAPYADTPESYEPFGRFAEPYTRFFVKPLEYRGWGRSIPEPEGLPTVKVGFLGPIEPTVSVATGGASHEEALGLMMLKGATLAVEDANARGGYRGTTPFELMVRNDNGLWGASGSEIVHLAYREGVWGILGTIDGANTHIAIRVALKIEIPIVNSGDTDPTLVETAIPWVFRVITDDRAMGYLLADYLFDRLGLTRVAALRANNRYGRIGIDELRDAATRRGHPFVAELTYRLGDTDFTAQIERVHELGAEAVVTWGNARESALIVRQMRALGRDTWLAGSERLIDPVFVSTAGAGVDRVVAASPWNPRRHDPRLTSFVSRFEARFGAAPDTQAAHAYDGMTMLLTAIDRAGLNRALIRDALAAMTTYRGVTGSKSFDAAQSHRGTAYLAVLRNGSWTYLNHDQAPEQ